MTRDSDYTKAFWLVAGLHAVSLLAAAILLFGLFGMPYTGLKHDALVFKAGSGAGNAYIMLILLTMLIPVRGLLVLFFFGGGVDRWTLALTAGFWVAVGLLTLAIRYDFTALDPGHIRIGMQRYGYEDVTAVELRCVTRKTTKVTAHLLMYRVQLKGLPGGNFGEWHDLMGTGEAGFKAIERLHARLVARGVSVTRAEMGFRCVDDRARTLKGDGLARLRAIGWVD
jgi:hypothetical protein